MSNVTWMLNIFLKNYFYIYFLKYQINTTVMRSFFIQ
jgi:hypothetical protein